MTRAAAGPGTESFGARFLHRHRWTHLALRATRGVASEPLPVPSLPAELFHARHRLPIGLHGRSPTPLVTEPAAALPPVPRRPKAPEPAAPTTDPRAVWDSSFRAVRSAPCSSLRDLRSLIRVRRGLAPIREEYLHRAREANAARSASIPSLVRRLQDHLLEKACDEIVQRGGETDIDGVELQFLDRDHGTGLVLVGCDG